MESTQAWKAVSAKFPFLLATIICCISSSEMHILFSSKGSLPWSSRFEETKYTVCYTKECQQSAFSLLQSLNTSVDPCEDFYRFSCEGWVKQNPVPPTESHRNQFDVVTDKLDFQIKDILEEIPLINDPEPVKAAKKFYATCMNTDAVEAEGLDVLNSLLDELGGWPIAIENWTPHDFNWISTLGILTRKFAVTPLILTYVYLDRKNSKRSIITIDQPPLILPRSMLVESDLYTHQTDAYRKWIVDAATEVAKSRKQIISPEVLLSDSFEIVKFESKLAKLTVPNEVRRNAYRNYNLLTLAQLQNWTDSKFFGTTHTKLEWMDLMQEIFRGVKIQLQSNEPVVVKELDFIIHLLEFLDQTPVRVIANYLQWHVVKASSRDVTNKMREYAFKFEKILSGAKEDQERWRDCIYRTTGSLSFAVGYKYVSQFFDQEAKKQAREMVKNIREAFISQMMQVDWMDVPTRNVAVEKAEAIIELIGYPDWYGNLTALEQFYTGVKITGSHLTNVVMLKAMMVHRVLSKLRLPTDRTEWNTSPDVVNAYYNPQRNSIIFPAGILQPPFFSKGRPEALNYGSIGVVIGHEIIHGFDDMGRQCDKYGNLVQWWSEATIDTYIAKAQCFVDQYGQYRVPELDTFVRTSVTMNGVTTQGENIADNGGLQQAFAAYKKFVEKNGPEPRLPGMEDFTPEQLFFLGFATVWCESSTPESLLQEVLSDPHSPHKFRVKGTLSNSEDFARVWNCPLGSSMNPEQKCSIW